MCVGCRGPDKLEKVEGAVYRGMSFYGALISMNSGTLPTELSGLESAMATIPAPAEWVCYHCTFSNTTCDGSECDACGRIPRSKRKREAGCLSEEVLASGGDVEDIIQPAVEDIIDPALMDGVSPTAEEVDILTTLASMSSSMAPVAPQHIPPIASSSKMKDILASMPSSMTPAAPQHIPPITSSSKMMDKLASISASMALAAPQPIPPITSRVRVKFEDADYEGTVAAHGRGSRLGRVLIEYDDGSKEWAAYPDADISSVVGDEHARRKRQYRMCGDGGKGCGKTPCRCGGVRRVVTLAGRNPSSQYRGVSWNKQQSKWVANIKVNGKQEHLGGFVDEKLAAEAYKEAERRFGTRKRSSEHRGVSWQKKARKWQATLTVKGTRYNLGYFDAEEDAAEVYKRALAGDFVVEKRTASSQFRGVFWEKSTSSWRVGIALEGQKFDLGRFDDEKLAAQAYTAAAEEHAASGVLPEKRERVFTSRHHGVYWNKVELKWTAWIKVDKKMRRLGNFDDEDVAAEVQRKAAAGGQLPEQRVQTSQHRGVSWSKGCQKWKSIIQVDGQSRHLGLFKDEEGAFEARKRADAFVAAGGVFPEPHRATSKHRGVCWDKARQKWSAKIKADGVHIYLGRFDDEELAAAAYAKAAAGAASGRVPNTPRAAAKAAAAGKTGKTAKKAKEIADVDTDSDSEFDILSDEEPPV
jgi:hypothetical protein